MGVHAFEAGSAVTDARRVYGAETRFGRRATVGPGFFLVGAMLIMTVGLVLRLWNLGAASLWTDEVLTAIRAQAPFREALKSLMSAGNQTPLYFWSLRLLPNSTEALLRLPSALLGLLGIALLMAVVWRFYHDREMALWAGALLAVNPFHVWLSRTARPYAMVFVLSLTITWAFFELWRGQRARRMWIVFTLANLVAYATHFTTVGLLGAQAMLFAFAFLAERRLRPWFRHWLAAQVLAAVPALTWTYVVLSRLDKEVTQWIARPELRDIPLTLWNMTLGYNGDFEWALVPGLMIVTLGLVFGVSYAIGEGRRDEHNFYWLWLFVGPLTFTFLLSTLIVSIYVDRYFMVFLPALLVLIVQGWYRFSPQTWRVALGLIIVTSAYTVLFSFYDGSFRREDWPDAAAYVAEHVQPGDAILLERDNTYEAFTRYYAQTEPYLAGEDDVQAVRLVMLAEMPNPDVLAQQADRLWVIYRNPNEDVHRLGVMPDFDPFDPHLTTLGEWLSTRRAQVQEIRAFNGLKVLLLDPDGE